jgi:hypothetical protein
MPWVFFPARLHTTKEMIYFLENRTQIKTIIEKHPSDLTNLIFGDIYHPSVIKETRAFLNTNPVVDTLILEVCSRKCYYYNTIPLNYYYTSLRPDLIKKYNLTPVSLSNEEIENDLTYIKTLMQCKIHIIPHLNLRTNGSYIPDRDSLVKFLEQLCDRLSIKCHNIGKYLESIDSSASLEKYMPDSHHYAINHDQVKQWLVSQITQ